MRRPRRFVIDPPYRRRARRVFALRPTARPLEAGAPIELVKRVLWAHPERGEQATTPALRRA